MQAIGIQAQVEGIGREVRALVIVPPAQDLGIGRSAADLILSERETCRERAGAIVTPSVEVRGDTTERVREATVVVVHRVCPREVEVSVEVVEVVVVARGGDSQKGVNIQRRLR